MLKVYQRRYLCGLAGSSFFACLLLSSASLNAAQLQPHKAVYDMRLSSAQNGVDIADINGRMVYELSGSVCDGFSVDLRFVVLSFDQVGGRTVTDLRSSYFEAPDNSRLSFTYKTFIDDLLTEQAQGTADHQASKVDVDLVGPDEKKMSFDGPIMFPLQHLHSVIDGAASGHQFMVSLLYDGSVTGEQLFEASTVVGKKLADPLDPRTDRVSLPDVLGTMDAWPISIAYFNLSDQAKGEQVPDYQLRSVLHENGVTRSMNLNYGAFELEGALVELELKPVALEGRCERPSANGQAGSVSGEVQLSAPER
ncbi:hypothetical protein PsAD2_04233 [Pseudovibrio axinellae]|uniref:DUF1849 family protein n=1 Tax=Pseudovibrio axinellae TaxID=989403 RepID=A0A161UZP9_9HYPH|nr:DUF1849 family protein [Pseudovibrio axinellae]KZL06720.1 hypothetical protein PsAD2_04233 [Pseudovibrio axinellae]SER61762.1 protein of unknown function [Pseudovibrio axinellae]